MSKNKIAKLLLALGIGVATVTSGVAVTGCNPESGGGNPSGSEQTQKHTVTFNLNGGTGTAPAQQVEDGKKAEAPAEPSLAGHTFDGWYTAEEGGTKWNFDTDVVSEDITLYAHWTENQQGDCGHGGTVESNPIVPEYKGEADGPEAGSATTTKKLLGSDLAKGTLAEDWTDGVITIPNGTEIRDRKDTTNKYTRSVKNGKISIAIPAAGTIKIVYSSGSSTVGNASYKLTKPDKTSDTQVINAADKVLQTLEITADAAGTYIFEKAAGTVDVWEIEVSYTSSSAPITELTVLSGGTTDYLITQQLDCTGVTLAALDANGITHDVNLENCKFDTSKYNPNVSGEYEIGVTYYLSSNLDSATKEFSATYTVKVYAVDSIKLSTVGLVSNKQVTLQQAYLPNGTFSGDNLSVMATCKLGGDTIVQRLKAEWYEVSAPDLTSEGVKTVTVSVNTNYTTGNKAVTATYEVAVKAKKDVTDNKVEITVGATGDFKTLTQAAQYLKACAYESGVNKIIKLQAGTYTEKVWLDVDNVTLIGLGANVDDTVLTYSLVEGDADDLSNSLWALNCATLHVTGANFKAYHLAIRNDFDYITNNGNYSGSQAAQGVALTLDNKEGGSVIYDCHLYGNQDTLYMKSGRSYYYKTQIDGNIDFIFGGESSIAYFEECKIVAINRETKTSDNPQNGYVTAPQHKEATKPTYGYVFYKCELTDDGNVQDSAMSLGRPWGPNATVSYIECKFSAAYSQTGTDSGKKINRWNDWNSSTTAAGADYSEYGSTDLEGNAIMSQAVQGGKVLDQATAANYTKDNVFGANNGKSGYTAWDCDAALTTLKILAGLQSGELPQEKTVTVNLKDETLPNGNCVAALNEKYADKLTWAGAGSFETAKPENGVKIGTDTVITLKIKGEVTLVAGYELPASDYIITYNDGLATIKFVAATGTYGSFIGSIVIDTSKVMPDTQTVTVTLNYNDGGTTQNGSVEAVVGAPMAEPAKPVRDGFKFVCWQKDGVDYDFSQNVTEAFTLTAKWEAAGDYDFTKDVEVDFLADYADGTVQSASKTWRGLTIDATAGKFAPRDSDVQVNSGTKLQFTAAAGTTADKITVSVIDYKGNELDASSYTVTVENNVVTIAFTANVYIKSFSLTYNA